MNQERWEELKEQIKNNFAVSDEYIEDLEPGTAEVLEFEGQQGLMRVKFVTRPKLMDKKTSYSNRVGSDVKVEYVYSDTESVAHLEVYIWSEEKSGWEKIDVGILAKF